MRRRAFLVSHLSRALTRALVISVTLSHLLALLARALLAREAHADAGATVIDAGWVGPRAEFFESAGDVQRCVWRDMAQRTHTTLSFLSQLSHTHTVAPFGRLTHTHIVAPFARGSHTHTVAPVGRSARTYTRSLRSVAARNDGRRSADIVAIIVIVGRPTRRITCGVVVRRDVPRHDRDWIIVTIVVGMIVMIVIGIIVAPRPRDDLGWNNRHDHVTVMRYRADGRDVVHDVFSQLADVVRDPAAPCLVVAAACAALSEVRVRVAMPWSIGTLA